MKSFVFGIAALVVGCGFGDNHVTSRGTTHHTCGDGMLDPGEACDDGNAVAGDGCSADCTVETVRPVCGNGTRENGEECDDGNTTPGDGCSAGCQVETPVTPACEVLPQSGCSGNTPACDLNDTGQPECRAVTSQGTANNHCSVDTACKAGYTCVGEATGTELPWCSRFCDADSQCPGTGSRCVDELTDAAGHPLGIDTCSNACDPYGQTGCPSGMGCVGVNATGGDFTDCRYLGAGIQGDACASQADCSDGYACVSPGECLAYCIVGNANTCLSGETCVGLADPLQIGAVEYGVCE